MSERARGMGDAGETRGSALPSTGSPDGGYEQFVRRHFHPLERSLSVITMDPGLAADAAQEAFLQLYLRWSEVDELEDPVAWLYRVGINRCYDYRRQLKRAARLFERLSAQTDLTPVSDRWMPDARFAGLVTRLPRQQRVAAVLFYQADLSTKEIARTMRISESAVKSHLQRAREALRPLVEGE